MDENDFDDHNDSIYHPYNDKPDDTKDDYWTYNTDQEDNVSVREEGHPNQESDHAINNKTDGPSPNKEKELGTTEALINHENTADSNNQENTLEDIDDEYYAPHDYDDKDDD